MQYAAEGIGKVIGLFDDTRYAALSLEKATLYQNADPFPYVILDNFFNPEILDYIADAFPTPNAIPWVMRDTEHNLKRYQHDETKFSPVIREFLRELNSRQFLLFLETLTGIDNLLPDPYYIGGGLHMCEPGGFLKIHADFNWHHKLQAHRRINVLIYLNKEWSPSWDGALELWDKEMKGPKAAIEPIFNRLVVFSTSGDSNHGHPRPLKCPKGTIRRSINLYYYTTRRDEAEITDPHFTMYKTEASPFASSLATDYKNSANEKR